MTEPGDFVPLPPAGAAVLQGYAHVYGDVPTDDRPEVFVHGAFARFHQVDAYRAIELLHNHMQPGDEPFARVGDGTLFVADMPTGLLFEATLDGPHGMDLVGRVAAGMRGCSLACRPIERDGAGRVITAGLFEITVCPDPGYPRACCWLRDEPIHALPWPVAEMRAVWHRERADAPARPPRTRTGLPTIDDWDGAVARATARVDAAERAAR